MLLYRIIDFLELIQMLRTQKLRVPSVHRFLDPDELIGNLLASMSHPSFSPYTMDRLDHLIGGQKALRECHYISCWTKQRDSMAMWEIYSRAHTNVQVQVEDADLELAFARFANERSVAKTHHTPPNHPETFFYPSKRAQCLYVKISDLYEELKSDFSVVSRALERAAAANDAEDVRSILGDARDAAAKRWEELIRVKNEAYSHEEEVRFSLHAVRRNDREYEECEKDYGFVLFDTHLRPSAVSETGENIFIDFPRSNVKHVYLDGRAPSWILEVQSALIGEHGIPVSRSAAYGSFIAQHPIEPWWTH